MNYIVEWKTEDGYVDFEEFADKEDALRRAQEIDGAWVLGPVIDE